MDKKYPESKDFKVLGAITLPHTYIVGVAKELFTKNGLGQDVPKDKQEEAIRNVEKEFGPSCAKKGCKLTFDEHVNSLVIEVNDEMNGSKEMAEFIDKCKPLMEEAGLTGISLVKREEVSDD